MIDNTYSFNIEAKVVLAILVSKLYSIISFTRVCYKIPQNCENKSLYASLMLLVMSNTINTVYIVCFFIFYTVYCRLRVFVEKISIRGNKILIQKSLDVYKAILDALDKVKKSFEFLFAAGLVFQSPLLVIGVYFYLWKMKENNEILFDDIVIEIARVLILLLAPAFSAGLLTSKAEELKQILQDRLLSERDEPHSSAIKLFLDYMRGRPMKFTVFESIPLDWSLLVIILNLCITYQIAMVQLTHLF
ncbi:hypothetical protein ABMA27_009057 [Loxostege sticticalis]|uniref:Gustatory receptor n=1 Tax=Loxostege sticticalis TaxID=481309 RepID=A0ABR3H9S2_LOXSC